jgi:hypothetical protein
MSLAAAAVLAGRRAAEALMVDTCTIRVRTGATTQSETTGQVTRTASTVYAGPCRVQQAQAQPQQHDAGERTVTVQPSIVSIPSTSVSIPVGAVITIDASVLSPALAGRVFRVTGAHHKSHATAQRLQVEEVTA